MVSAEFALAFPAVIIVLALIVGAGAVASAKVRACDLARVGARAAAIGAPAPEGSVEVIAAGAWIDAKATVSVVGIGGRLAPTVTCTASAPNEEVSP